MKAMNYRLADPETFDGLRVVITAKEPDPPRREDSRPFIPQPALLAVPNTPLDEEIEDFAAMVERFDALGRATERPEKTDAKQAYSPTSLDRSALLLRWQRLGMRIAMRAGDVLATGVAMGLKQAAEECEAQADALEELLPKMKHGSENRESVLGQASAYRAMQSHLTR